MKYSILFGLLVASLFSKLIYGADSLSAPIIFDAYNVYKDFKSTNFKNIIIKSRIPSESLINSARSIDSYVGQIRTILNVDYAIKGKLTIVLLRNRDELTSYSAPTPVIRDACYSPGKQETLLTIVSGDNPNEYCLQPEVARHEITHHFFHYITGIHDDNPWLNEGLACFFQYWDTEMSVAENLQANRSRAETGYYNYFPKIILDDYKQDRFVNFSNIANLDFKNFHDEKVERRNYSYSWFFVYSLMMRPEGQAAIKKLLVDTRKHGAKGMEIKKADAALFRDYMLREIQSWDKK